MELVKNNVNSFKENNLLQVSKTSIVLATASRKSIDKPCSQLPSSLPNDLPTLSAAEFPEHLANKLRQPHRQLPLQMVVSDMRYRNTFDSTSLKPVQQFVNTQESGVGLLEDLFKKDVDLQTVKKKCRPNFPKRRKSFLNTSRNVCPTKGLTQDITIPKDHVIRQDSFFMSTKTKKSLKRKMSTSEGLNFSTFIEDRSVSTFATQPTMNVLSTPYAKNNFHTLYRNPSVKPSISITSVKSTFFSQQFAPKQIHLQTFTQDWCDSKLLPNSNDVSDIEMEDEDETELCHPQSETGIVTTCSFLNSIDSSLITKPNQKYDSKTASEGLPINQNVSKQENVPSFLPKQSLTRLNYDTAAHIFNSPDQSYSTSENYGEEDVFSDENDECLLDCEGKSLPNSESTNIIDDLHESSYDAPTSSNGENQYLSSQSSGEKILKELAPTSSNGGNQYLSSQSSGEKILQELATTSSNGRNQYLSSQKSGGKILQELEDKVRVKMGVTSSLSP